MSDSASVIQIPDAAAEPAAYVQALLEVLGDRDPLDVLRSLTPQQLERRGAHSEQGGEDVRLMVRKLAGHDLAHLEQMRNAITLARSQEGMDPATVDSLLRMAEQAFAAQDLDAICA